jgi:hypothetical protein
VKRAAAVAVLAAGFAVAAWLAWPRQPLSDEERVREVIARVARRAGAKEVGGMLEDVSERYRGEPGDKATLRQMLFTYLRRSDWVSAVPARLQVQVAGDRARAAFVALLVRRPAKGEEDVRPEELAGSFAFEVDFEREGDRWRAVDARRREAGAAEWLRQR